MRERVARPAAELKEELVSPDVLIGGRPGMQIASILSEPYRLIASPHVSPLGFALVACPIEGRGSTLCPRVCSLSRSNLRTADFAFLVSADHDQMPLVRCSCNPQLVSCIAIAPCIPLLKFPLHLTFRKRRTFGKRFLRIEDFLA